MKVKTLMLISIKMRLPNILFIEGMLMHKAILFFIVSMFFLMSGTHVLAQDNSVLERQWQVQNIDNKAVAGQTPLTLTFKNNGEFQGNSGCNQFSGGYKLTADNLIIEHAVSTERACVETELNEQEAQFMKLFMSMTQAKLNDQGQLVLSNGKNQQIILSMQR
jgi:heat shock protein HslJ